MQETISLIGLPFAGGSACSYRDLKASLAPSVDFCPIEPHGRGRRFSEALLADIHAMAEDALRQVRALIESRPYALYGHSLGAKVAYLMACGIATRGLPQPEHLFVSGSAAPSVPPRSRTRHLLPRQAFFDLIRSMSGTATEIFESSELLDLFEPVLRADFEANDTYCYQKQEPLSVPLTVMIGTEDTVSYTDAFQWERETTGQTRILRFPGGHFFINKHCRAIAHLISQALEASLVGEATPLQVGPGAADSGEGLPLVVQPDR
jgi:surfactin synthase thioesterase subunit